MQLIDLVQGSEGWKQFKLGRISGTRLGSIWSSRQYTVSDIEDLLRGRNIDLTQFQQTLNANRKAAGLKARKYTKADLETLLTDADKDQLSQDADKKLEYYQILADQIAVGRDDEVFEDGSSYYNAMERGTGLEATACEKAAELLGKRIFEVGCCASDDDDRIINSPDRLIWPDKFEGGTPELIDEVNSGKLKITEAIEAKCLASAKHLMAFIERQIPEEYWTQKVQYFTVNPDLKRLYWVFYDPRIPMIPLFILVIERDDLGHWPETMLKYQKRTMRELDDLTNWLFEESTNLILPAKAEKV